MSNVLKDWVSTNHILFDDVLCAASQVGGDGDGYFRRSYVRAAFTAIEGSTFGMKRVALEIGKQRHVSLDADELELLTETKVDQQGNVRKRFLPFGENVKFAFKTFAKVHGCLVTGDYGVKGWTCLLNAAEIRNRLMHPKSSADLNVSDADLDVVQMGADWFFKTRDRLVASATNELKNGI